MTTIPDLGTAVAMHRPGGERPTHIVVFRRPGGRNAATVARAIGAAAKPMTVSGRPGLMAMAGASAPQGRYYARFGVAAVSLDEEQYRSLQTDPTVEGVYANLVRAIPRPVTRMASAAAISAVPKGSHSGSHGATEAYLQGVIDAATGALRAMRTDIGSARNTRAASASQLSWALRALGVTHKSTVSGKGIKVAVLDTGIDRSHPDLRDRVVAYRNFANGSSDNDVVEHGTHCAGIVAGSARPAEGVRYGVAPGASLIIGKVLGDDGTGWDDDIFDAMDWAVDEGARVISMSLGAERAINQPFSASYEQLARNFGETTPGVLVVAAAGNESQRHLALLKPVGNPAACPSIMSVAALDEQRQIAWFSCAAMDGVGAVDIAAPGVDVLSAKPGGSTQLMSGTSMAAPQIAGLAALYLQRGPGLTAAQLWRTLAGRCLPAGLASDVGSGLAQVP